jgi:hypothetical protein
VDGGKYSRINALRRLSGCHHERNSTVFFLQVKGGNTLIPPDGCNTAGPAVKIRQIEIEIEPTAGIIQIEIDARRSGVTAGPRIRRTA